MGRLGEVRKFIVAVVGAMVTSALGLGLPSPYDKICIVLSAGITALSVYAVPNDPAPPTR